MGRETHLLTARLCSFRETLVTHRSLTSAPISSMQQLTRQRTRDSILSWWSDSNPGLQGATINLHALAKPLMRRMYDHDALKYLRNHREVPLSAESVEIYLSYLFWKYVSPSTKEEIIQDLAERVRSEDVAHAAVHSNILPDIRSLLLPESDLKSADAIIGALAKHPFTTLAACSSLVDLLSDGDVDVVASAWEILDSIVLSSEGARFAVEAKVLDHVPSGLSSPNPRAQYWTCWVVCELSEWESTLPAVMRALPEFLVTLVKLLESAEGAEAAVAANILDPITRWLSEGDLRYPKMACNILEQLIRHNSTLSAIVRVVPRERVVSLLRYFQSFPAFRHRLRVKSYRETAEQILIKMDAYLESHSEPSPGLHETHLPSRPEAGAFRYPEDLEPED